MNLDEWANRWGVSAAAMYELRQMFRTDTGEADLQAALSGKLEGATNAALRLEATRQGGRLWRNNVGQLLDKNGRPVRYGLANDSKKVNQRVKSSDLVGIRPVVIQPHHVGNTFGLFVARECKRPGWNYTGTDRERAQLRFLELVASLGGDAKFATSGEDW